MAAAAVAQPPAAVTAALEARVDDTGLHRYNARLPLSYREKLRGERLLQLRALRTLADSILASGAEASALGGEDTDSPASREGGYSRPIERDLSAFEKGICRYLDLKYQVPAHDYPLFTQVLLRGLSTYDLDMGLRAKLARAVSRVIRKRDCVLPDGIPFRPILDVVVKVHLDSVNGGPFVGKDVRDAHCRNMLSLLQRCRDYVPKGDSADRIYGEHGPKISISSPDAAFEHLLILSHILPTRGSASLGWLPDALLKFPTLANAPEWDAAWLGLFSRVARHQPCIFDWTPHLPHMYARIVDAFKLPLGPAAPQHPVERRCPHHCIFLISDRTVSCAAILAAYTLSPRMPAALEHLERLVNLIANFFHPSNGGRWTGNLGAFLHSFTVCLTGRVIAERAATKAGVVSRVIGTQHDHAVAPAEDRLTQEMVDRLVSQLLPLVQHGLHSKSNSMTMQAASASRDLAVLAPHLVVEPLIAIAAECLESLSSPHRTSAALKMLSALTPVLLDPELCPNGAVALPQALTLTLPGIDPNDPSKTEASLRFIAGAAARMQSMLTDETGTSELSYFVEDFTHQLLERVFPLLDTLEAPPKKARNGTVPSQANPQLSSFIFAVAMDNLFAAVPGSVARAAAERVARHITGSASLNALKYYGALVRSVAAAAAANSEEGSSASIFIPRLLDQLLVDSSSTLPEHEMELAPLSEDELVWRLRMLAQVCRTCGSGVNHFASQIASIVSLSFKRSERRVYKAGGRLLRGVLEGLTAVQTALKGLDDSNSRTSQTNGDSANVRGEQDPNWNGDLSDSELEGHCWNVVWNIPSEADWRLGESLVWRFLHEAEKMARDEDGAICLDRDTLFRVLRMLHATQRGGRWITAGVAPERFRLLDRFVDDSDPDGVGPMTIADAKLALRRPVYAGLGGERDNVMSAATATELWARVYSLVSDITSAVVADRPDDGALLYRCLEPIELAHEPFRRSNQGRLASHACRGYKAAYRTVVATKRAHDAVGGVGRAMPGFIFKLRVEAQHEFRLYNAARGGIDNDVLFEKIMSQTTDLSVNAFPRVRAEARGVLTRAWRVAYPMSRRREIERVIGVLEEAALATNEAQKRKTAGQVLENSNPSAMGASSSVDVAGSSTDDPVDMKYEILIGAASVLRSAAAAPILMRDWDLFSRVTRVLLKAIVAAERPDAGAAVGGLFAKLSGLVRPLSIRSFSLARGDLSSRVEDFDVSAMGEAALDRLKSFNELSHYLIGMLSSSGGGPEGKSNQDALPVADNVSRGAQSRPGESSAEGGATQNAHWRLQSLVATVLTICLREGIPPPPEVAGFFAEGMVSDVVSVRHIATRGVALILAMHGPKGRFGSGRSALVEGPTINAAIETIGNVLKRPGFGKALVHTLALDHDDGVGTDGTSSGHSARSFGVFNFARFVDGDACYSMVGGRPWPASWVGRSRDTFNILQVRLYEDFCRVYGGAMLSAFGPTLEELIKSADLKKEGIIDGVHDDNVRIVAGELAAGMCRGLLCDVKEADGTSAMKIFAWVDSLLNGFTGPQGSMNGGSLIRLIVSASPGTLGFAIAPKIVQSVIAERPIVVAMDQGSVAHLQARRLRYAHACVADLDPEDAKIASDVAHAAAADLSSDVAFGHELKNVREEVARLLSLLGTFRCGTVTELFSDAVGTVASRQGSLLSKSLGSNDGSGTPSEGVADEETVRKVRSRQGETLSRWVSIVYWNGDALGFSHYLPRLLPAVVASLDEESDQDRVSHTRLALSLAAQGAISPECIAKVVSSCEELAKSPTYRIRGALLPFLQVFSFSVLYTAEAESLERMRAIVVQLLSDPQLEVRESAGATFVTFIRDTPPSVIAKIRADTLQTLAASNRPHRRGRQTTLSAEDLCRRHGAVLCLGSMVMSAPYDVPEWMPCVLVALTDCINDPPPISTSTKSIFADFMRTHRDEWQTHKLSFSADQLERVSELMVSPSYYA